MHKLERMQIDEDVIEAAIESIAIDLAKEEIYYIQGLPELTEIQRELKAILNEHIKSDVAESETDESHDGRDTTEGETIYRGNQTQPSVNTQIEKETVGDRTEPSQ